MSWSVAQEMYTANDIEDRNPSAGDHPYAGILYVDNVIYARREGWAHVWELKAGVVGPASYADETQKGVHHAIGSNQPQGWHTQMPNAPIVNVGYTVTHKVAEGIRRSSRTRSIRNSNMAVRRARERFSMRCRMSLISSSTLNLAEVSSSKSLQPLLPK